MKATAIIGGVFGDEGKANLTDYFSTRDTTVVRYCSGANAGHTCVRDGKRHVFHHFGSGSLRGASTYLSRFFINNPILYFQELEVLRGLGCEPTVVTDPNGMVTTPYDMMINQIIEEARGNARHGSCGVGINETIKRDEAGYVLRVDDLRLSLRDRLIDIQTKWVPERLHQLAVEPSTEWLERLNSRNIMDSYIEHCDEYVKTVRQSYLRFDKNIVFEGAQGLLLDEDHHFFPHVTHSHTGLKNVVELANEVGIEKLDVLYLTRAYATRHGAGPFPREVVGLSYEDQTNVPNMWQGNLRFGHLDLDLLVESIEHDLQHATLPVRHGLAITCLDQVNDTVSFWHKGERQIASRQELMHRAFEAVGAEIRLSSYGPDAASICDNTQ